MSAAAAATFCTVSGPASLTSKTDVMPTDRKAFRVGASTVGIGDEATTHPVARARRPAVSAGVGPEYSGHGTTRRAALGAPTTTAIGAAVSRAIDTAERTLVMLTAVNSDCAPPGSLVVT